MSSHPLLKRALKLSFAILINKPIGYLREILTIRYLGVGLCSDAFWLAWGVPNTLRRIFSEGMLSSILVPTLVREEAQHGKKGINEMTSVMLVIFQLFLTFLCLTMSYYAYPFLSLMAPGALERVAYAVPLLRILVYFILFMSFASMLGAALQTKHKFLVGPVSQFVLNIALCIEFWICNRYNLPVQTLAWMLLANGIIVVVLHLYTYYREGFGFTMPSLAAWKQAGSFLKKFIPLLASSIVELNFLVNQAIASYLPVGSQSMLQYISNFVRIPSQVLGSSFATVSSPHFAHVAHHSPRRLAFHLFESCKMITWTVLPALICMLIFSKKILLTLLLSKKFTLVHVTQGALLMQLLSGAIFFSVLNRILLNVYYALHETILPTLIAIGNAGINIVVTYFSMRIWGLPGIAGATIIVEAIRSLLLIFFLASGYRGWRQRVAKISIPWKKWVIFCMRSCIQILVIGLPTFWIYRAIHYCMHYLSAAAQHYLYDTVIYWLWVGPLVLLAWIILYKSRTIFGLKLYYLGAKSK